MRKLSLPLVLLFTCCLNLRSQQALDFIPLQNPSFEDMPGIGKLPLGWYFCGPVNETPPDIHPGGWFKVTKEAHEGFTYVGMVVRDNNTVESIGQRLRQPMVPGQCYQFRLYAARSLEYSSISRATYQLAVFDQPVQLRLWAATKNCIERVLLGESQAIENPEWTAYDFQFEATEAFNHLILEAYYTGPNAYNGSVLIDKLSPLMMLKSCESSSRPTLPDLNALASIDQLVASIRFDPITEQLETHYFQDKNGNDHYLNQFIWQLVKSLDADPKQKLLFAIGGLNKTSIQTRMLSLQQMLMQAGLNPKRFTIRKLRKKDGKKPWDGGSVEGEVLLRVR